MQQQTVFIVDDDQSVRLSLSAMVEARGAQSRSYDSAERFLESGDFRSPGCVVTDLRMGGMSGFKLAERLWQEGVRNPVIVITGYADAASTEDVGGREQLTILEKTCNGQELWEAIQRALAAFEADVSDGGSTRDPSS